MLSFVSPKQKNSETLTDVLFDSNTTVSNTSNHLKQNSSDLLKTYDWNTSPFLTNTLHSPQHTVHEEKQYVHGVDTKQYKDPPKQHVDEFILFVNNTNYSDNTKYPDNANYADHSNFSDNTKYPDNANYADNSNFSNNTYYPDNATYADHSNLPDNTEYSDHFNFANTVIKSDNMKESDDLEPSAYISPKKKLENDVVILSSKPGETIVYAHQEKMDSFNTTLKPTTSSGVSNFSETKKRNSMSETENYLHCFKHDGTNTHVHNLNSSLLKSSSKISFLPLYVNNHSKAKHHLEEKPMDSFFQKNNYNMTLKRMLEQKLSTHQQQSPHNLFKSTDCVKPALKYKQETQFIHTGNHENDVYNIQGKGPLSIFVGNIPSTVTPEILYNQMQLRGKVTDIVCDFKKDSWMTAFVTFSKTDQAEKAIASLNGRRVFKHTPPHRLVSCFAPHPPSSLIYQSGNGLALPNKKKNGISDATTQQCLTPFYPQFEDVPEECQKQISHPHFSLLRDGPPGANLFVYGIPCDWSEVTFMRLCQKFGHIVGIRVPCTLGSTRFNKGFGFVSYDSIESSSRAFNFLLGRHIFGKTLIVQVKCGERLPSNVMFPKINTNCTLFREPMLERKTQNKKGFPIVKKTILNTAITKPEEKCKDLFMETTGFHDMSIKSPEKVFSSSSTTDDKGPLSTSSHYSINPQTKFGVQDNSSNTFQTNTSFNTKAFQETSLDLCPSAFSLHKLLPVWEHHETCQIAQNEPNGSSSCQPLSQINQNTTDAHPSHSFYKESKLLKMNLLQNIHKKHFISLLKKDQQSPIIQNSQEQDVKDCEVEDVQCIQTNIESCHGTPHSRSQTKAALESLENELIMTPYKMDPSYNSCKKKTLNQNNEPFNLSPSKTYQFLHKMKTFDMAQNFGENEPSYSSNIPGISLPNSVNTELRLLKEHLYRPQKDLFEQKKQHVNLSDTLLTEKQLPLISPFDYLLSKGNLQPPTFSNTVYHKKKPFYHDKCYATTSKTSCNTTLSSQVLDSPRSNTISHFCSMVENYLHRL